MGLSESVLRQLCAPVQQLVRACDHGMTSECKISDCCTASVEFSEEHSPGGTADAYEPFDEGVNRPVARVYFVLDEVCPPASRPRLLTAP